MRDAKTPNRNLWVTLGLRSAEKLVEITVADSGPGVPAEMRGRVFEPGFTTKSDGHGFGLSTVYRIVQNHHGRMTVEASAINGALFRIVLPDQQVAGDRSTSLDHAPRSRVASSCADPVTTSGSL